MSVGVGMYTVALWQLDILWLICVAQAELLAHYLISETVGYIFNQKHSGFCPRSGGLLAALSLSPWCLTLKFEGNWYGFIDHEHGEDW